jgi:dTDP-4-dehydrorhamnose reductase
MASTIIYPKTIMILGGSGMLGNYITSYLKKTTSYIILSLSSLHYNVETDPFEKIMDRMLDNLSQRDVVINCIGIIPQKVEQDQLANIRKYFKVNSLFPHLLSDFCNKKNYHLIHITTDCVFNGMTGNYVETDSHNATSIYGISKSLGEPANCTIIRTSIIGEELGSGPGKSLLEWVKSNKNGKISGYTNHLWNGVTCLKLAEIISQIISNKSYWYQVHHIFSNGNISKYKLCSMINEIYELNITVEPTETITPKNMTLSTIHRSTFEVGSIEQQIKDMKNFKL